ncbi:hypothetical protein FB567DRAFT_569387 [Paraphoma chrysanthemicola]|uniref:BZIP domain-containing protein n=1 Tax=Paraphoma chrysanthemicola TaxID=798071 RepID=A0A8K0RA78_9PLEO|nr:hypothetical protein FB567DRAFT_569387 [Paraphoma chrysanthemicola]
MDPQQFDSFFSQTMTTSTLMASAAMTPPPSDSVPTTIKMEDLQVPYDTPSPAPSSQHDMSQCGSTPAPTNADGKPVKKRKSWGQVLPEPKTSLPPRKRAKTEDEKEQRRIERVKRNRLAAHNSRERKRQEYEVLQAEKDRMEADLQSYKDQMAQMKAQLDYFRTKYPGEAPETTFDLSTSALDDTICPARTSASFPSPISMDSMDSPRDSSCQPETPASFEVATPEFDSTQYPAAILCDLQCRSDSGPVASAQLAAILAYLTLFQHTLQSTRSLLSSTAFSTLTSSQKALRLPWNPLTAWLILMSTSLAQPSLATAQTQPLLAFLTALMQSSLTCRVPLAQLTLATRLSQRSSSVEAVNERSSKGTSEAGPEEGAHRLRLMKSSKLRQLGRRRRVTTTLKNNRHASPSSSWAHMAQSIHTK